MTPSPQISNDARSWMVFPPFKDDWNPVSERCSSYRRLVQEFHNKDLNPSQDCQRFDHELAFSCNDTAQKSVQ
jgi:hypothetical protein